MKEWILRQIREKLAKGSRKMIEARELLGQRYAEMREQVRQTGNYEPLSCRMLIHRVVLTVDLTPWSRFPWKAFEAIPGARIGKSKSLWKYHYALATPIRGIGSIREITILSRPTNGFTTPFRIVIVPNRKFGLQWTDFQTILEILPNFKITLLEAAWDFPLMSTVDLRDVNETARFGKSRPLRVGIFPSYASWGSRKGLKFVRSYAHFETGIHRVELELHAQLLKRRGVNGPADFPQLVKNLLEKHILFARLDRLKLIRQLRRSGYDSQRRQDILQQVGDRSESLWEALNYLRRRLHLTNVHRLLVPGDTNRLVRKAAEEWITNWEKEQDQWERNQ